MLAARTDEIAATGCVLSAVYFIDPCSAFVYRPTQRRGPVSYTLRVETA